MRRNSADENAAAKVVLDRIVAMLTRLGRRGYTVREEPAQYATVGIDPDADRDSDPEMETGLTSRCRRRGPRRHSNNGRPRVVARAAERRR